MVELIQNIEQLVENLKTVEYYLNEGTKKEKEEMGGYIARGTILLCYKFNNQIKFSPSRFIGYQGNNLSEHANNYEKDGTVTTPQISKILGVKEQQNDKLRKEFFQYCEKIGFSANNKKHKFWFLNSEIKTINQEFFSDDDLNLEFPEGKIIEKIHKSRERNSQVIQIAKSIFKQKNGKLFCQICGFDFEQVYGEVGKDFIEGHHTIAVSDMEANYKTRPEEIALLCSNCHRMVHKKRPWLSLDDLNNLLKK